MHAIRLIQEGFEHLHQAVRDDLAEVDQGWLFWQPGNGLNHIGFLLWHLVRDEDTVTSYLAKEGQLWEEAGWASRLGLDPGSQGTGLDPELLPGFRYEPPLFLEYAEAVWAATPDRVARLSEDDLDLPAWPGSEWNVGRQLVEGLLCHGWVHLGEIRSIMGLRGWHFRE